MRSLEEARELARTAIADGVTAIAATPHVRDDYPTRPALMEQKVAELRADFVAEGIALEVLRGGEVDLAMIDLLSVDELRRFTLAGSGRYLLVEFPDRGWPLALDAVLYTVQSAGMTALLAHPERNREVQERPQRLEAAVAAGALVQLTAASLDGRGGRSARAAARNLLELGLVHVLASDAHAPSIRTVGLASAVAQVGNDDLARYLTVDAPAAIVAGTELPARPRPRRRKRFGLPRTGIMGLT